MVVSLIALFVALGGTSYAALKITGNDVKNGSLTGKDIKKGSLGSNEVAGLMALDFSAGQLPAGSAGPKGDAGQAGARGATGSQGPKGDTGNAGAAGPKGDPGDAGPAGANGDTGSTGPQGAPGSDGAARAYARVNIYGGQLVTSQSKGVVGVEKATRLYGKPSVRFGAYCFDLAFSPVSVIANTISSPDDKGDEPDLHTIAPATDVLGTDNNGDQFECPPDFQDAAVVGRRQAGAGLDVGSGGFFVLFN